jgi:DNA polymerase-3 subunit epsilon
MRLQLQRPLVVFDIEATGSNWEWDRIIDLAAIRLEPDGRQIEAYFRFNPEVPIPAEATRIHNIRDEDVANAPKFRDRVAEVEAVFRDADLAGFNIWRFDVPILRQEFKRAGWTFEMAGRRLVDAQRIFHLKERRDLSAAVRFYLGREHAGAHGAMADAKATLEVLLRQLEVYKDLPTTPEGLEQFCFPPTPGQVDRAGRVARDADGELVLAFGRYRGRRLREMAAEMEGRRYLEWMLRQEFGPEVMELVRSALEGRLQEPARPDSTNGG